MKKLQSLPRLFGTGIFVLATLVQLIPTTAFADTPALQITNRSLTLTAMGATGGSLPGGTVQHTFKFTLKDTADNLGSIKFQYCTTAAPVPNGIDCVAPLGVSTLNANMSNESGALGFTGMAHGSEDDAADGVNNTFTLSRTTAAPLAAQTDAAYDITSVVNPSDPINRPEGMTFFVRISTYASLDGTGTPLEAGTVAAATNYAIDLSGTMPESLVFCTGATIDVNAGDVPDCATATAGTIAFDRLFSPTDTAVATSEMAASTNAGFGYTIAVHGATLTSGSNTIAPMKDGTTNGATASIQGIPQFGMNLVANTTTADVPFGTDVTQTGGALYTGTPTTDYNTPEMFKYNDTDPVASSTGGSDAQIYTVAYMANVSGSQPAGTYATTLTYICTPKF